MNANTIRPADTEFDALIQSILDAAADDGLLAGRELESDAELLELPGLSRRDKIQFGWVDPDEHAIERATREGRIGGQRTKNAGCVTDYESEYVTQPTYFDLPKIPNAMRSLAWALSMAFTPRCRTEGQGATFYLAANASIAGNGGGALIAHRYGLGKGRIQTLIRVQDSPVMTTRQAWPWLNQCAGGSAVNAATAPA